MMQYVGDYISRMIAIGKLKKNGFQSESLETVFINLKKKYF